MSTSVNRVFAEICLCWLSGCTVGPKYVRPSVAIPPAYKEIGGQDAGIWKPSQPQDGASRGNWWEAFGDPRLNDLENKLNGSNQNIVAAAAAVTEARAVIRESRSQFFPTVTGGASITNQHLSTFGPKVASATYSIFSLPVEASWEPDLWGRVKNTVKASTYAAQASLADLENVRLAAQADLLAGLQSFRDGHAQRARHRPGVARRGPRPGTVAPRVRAASNRPRCRTA